MNKIDQLLTFYQKYVDFNQNLVDFNHKLDDFNQKSTLLFNRNPNMWSYFESEFSGIRI